MIICIWAGVFLLLLFLKIFFMHSKCTIDVKEIETSSVSNSLERKAESSFSKIDKTRSNSRTDKSREYAGVIKEVFKPILSSEEIQSVLWSLNNEDFKVRESAWRVLEKLSTEEKIFWLSRFSRDSDVNMRVQSLKATRLCFGIDNFNKKARALYKDAKRRKLERMDLTECQNAIVNVDMTSLPSKREMVEICSIVRSALKDNEAIVRNEAIRAAASFDVETSNSIYQYAMMSCDDTVRLAVIREVEYGDDDFKLRLLMAALDLGGEEVVRIAIQGIEKVTGKRFKNSQDAFIWYDNNSTK